MLELVLNPQIIKRIKVCIVILSTVKLTFFQSQ